MRDVAAKPAIRIQGQSTWDEGFASMRKAIDMLEAEGKRLNLATSGPVMSHFLESDDTGYTYEAYLPLQAPAVGALGKDFTSAETPAGKAMVFPHEGAYDDIDSAYEAITAYLDEKGLTATGRFLEVYTSMPQKSDDPGMKLDIIVFLK